MLDPDAIELLVQRTRGVVGRMYLPFFAERDDVVQQVIASLLSSKSVAEGAGRVPEWIIRGRALDAILELGRDFREGGGRSYCERRYISFDEQADRLELSERASSPTLAPHPEIVKQLASDETPIVEFEPRQRATVELIRAACVQHGQQWGPVLEATVAAIVTDAAVARREGGRIEDEERVKAWIRRNPGRQVSQVAIAREIRSTRDTVSRLMARMVRDGELERTEGPGRSARWRIVGEQ